MRCEGREKGGRKRTRIEERNRKRGNKKRVREWREKSLWKHSRGTK